MNSHPEPPREQPTGDSSAGTGSNEPAAKPVIASEELLQGSQEVEIQHGSDVYRLRVTRNGKLILHK